MKTEILNTLDINQTIGNMVATRPSRAKVFERWGLDYCCGGKKPIGAACEEKGLDVEALRLELAASDARTSDATEADWTVAPLDELMDNIVAAHHEYLREELPRLSSIIEKVVRAHGQKHCDLEELAAVFSALRHELEHHTSEEERLLFPRIKSLQRSSPSSGRYDQSFGSMIETLEREHDQAGAELEKLRTLSNDYVPPSDACNTYRAMLDGLAELEADMHRHVHKENSILFPRAAELESLLTGVS